MTYYQILEIDASANAVEIKKAFRRLAMKYHPDISNEEEAETRFKIIYIAYDILSDPHKRKLYDEFQLHKHIEEESEPVINEWRRKAYSQAGRYSRMQYREFDDSMLSKITFHTHQGVAFLFCFALLCVGIITLGIGFMFINGKYFNGAYVLGTGSFVTGVLFLFYGAKGLIGVFSTWQGKEV